MSGIYDVTLAPGASAQIPASGGYVKVTAAPMGAVQVKLDGGEGYSLLEGQGIRLPDGKSFRDVQIKNLATLAQTILVFIGDTRFEDTRITGTVRLIDSSADKTQAGKQFLGGTTTAGGAGVWSQVNLNANGKTVSVKRIFVVSPTAGEIVYGSITSPGTSTPSTNPALNKLIGSASSTARYGSGTFAAAAPTGAEAPGFSGNMMRLAIAASTVFVVDLSASPYVISGTQGMTIFDGNTGNRQIGAFFDIEELT